MNTPLPATHTLVEHLSRDLTDRHGPILGGVALARALGFGSLAALRQARRRRQVEVKLFALPHRRGAFALCVDVARWLAEARQRGLKQDTTEEDAADPDSH